MATAYRRMGQGQAAAWITTVAEDQAMARARRLEQEGPRGRPLWGVPFAVKDNIDVAGMPTTVACPAFADTADETAPAVQRLLDAGAVLVGKTNLDQFATGLVGTRTPYGACHSALDPRRIAGGSSSGSAVVVAEGVVPFTLGTDTAGSGRVPAACNGIVGLKPSRGLVSTRGVVPACRSFDCVSVFARSVADAATVLDVLTGPPGGGGAGDGVGRVGADRWRVGVPPSSSWGLSGEQAAAYGEVVAGHREEDAAEIEVREVDPAPLLAAGALLYGSALVAERLTTIGPLLGSDPEAIHPVVRQAVSPGLDHSAVDVFTALHRLAELRERFRPVWSDVDVLLCPTVPDIPTLAAVEADPIGANTALGRWTSGANLLDLCALTVPAGRRPDGLPGSVTLLGPSGRDQQLAAAVRDLVPPA